MTLSTKDYEIFKLRADNRAKINKKHVNDLAESIKARNLLHWKPISVNSDMEILDGQHRFLAAKSLGEKIYYNISDEFKAEDIILMNISKSWGQEDYLNYYIKNHFPEYLKLEKFSKDNNVCLKIALHLTIGSGHEPLKKFKSGAYVFPEENFSEYLEVCWMTIGLVKKQNGYSHYTSSNRFWQCLIKMSKHPDFNRDKWMFNLERLISRMGPKANSQGYMRMIQDIYNFKNSHKIDLFDEKTVSDTD